MCYVFDIVSCAIARSSGLYTSCLARPAAAQQQAWQAICSAAVSYLFNYLILTISAGPLSAIIYRTSDQSLRIVSGLVELRL